MRSLLLLSLFSLTSGKPLAPGFRIDNGGSQNPYVPNPISKHLPGGFGPPTTPIFMDKAFINSANNVGNCGDVDKAAAGVTDEAFGCSCAERPCLEYQQYDINGTMIQGDCLEYGFSKELLCVFSDDAFALAYNTDGTTDVGVAVVCTAHTCPTPWVCRAPNLDDPIYNGLDGSVYEWCGFDGDETNGASWYEPLRKFWICAAAIWATVTVTLVIWVAYTKY